MFEDSRQYTVWARVVWGAVDTAIRGGLPIDTLFDGLPFDAVTLRKLGKVDWEDYCRLVERIETLAGGPEACERLLAANYHSAHSELAVLVVTPRRLYGLLSEVILPIVFPAVDMNLEDLGPNRIRISHAIRAGARECLALQNGTIGAFRGLPQHLGLPCAVVGRREVRGRRAVYELRLPEVPSLGRRLGQASRALFHASVDIVLGYTRGGDPMKVTFQEHDGGDAEARILNARQIWNLSPRQGEVLAEVARGRANKEIASALGCTEATVEAHVTQILQRSGVDSRARLIARFWAGV